MRGFTESQAAARLCPFQAASESGDLSPCVGDRCMGWVWLEKDHEYGRTAADQQPEGLGWARVGTIDGTSTWKRLRSNVDRLGCCARLMATPQLPIPREVPTR